ncbi:MAG: hypothetical protein WCL19_10565 [Verrucomicrobiota bacterium]
MTPGPVLIVKVPGCKTPLMLDTIASGNTFGATFWTDFKCDAPMMPDDPWLKKHPVENVLFWSDDYELIESIEFEEFMERRELRRNSDVWENRHLPKAIKIPSAEYPDEADYFFALKSGMADSKDKLCELRMKLWWAGNDAIRKGEVDALSKEHLENLVSIIALFDEDTPPHRLIRAEAFREQGLFKEALALLDIGGFDHRQAHATFIASLCFAKDRRVAKIPGDH